MSFGLCRSPAGSPADRSDPRDPRTEEKKLAAEVEKFRVGKSTNILVLQAQRDFTASRLDEASAMVAYLDALVSLYQSEGSLLERRGINALTD
jgi:outer membrane protein TolC